MEKLLTIGIPAYNIEKYLKACLDSVLGENVREKLEVLIVNDGSTDHTREIAQNYAEQYPNTVRLINKENGGWGSAVNLAMREAKGKYFKDLDSDDWFRADGLQKLLCVLKEQDADLVVSPALEHFMDTEKERPIAFPKECRYEEKMDFSALCHGWDTLLFMSTLTYRTAILQKENVTLDTCFYTDMELLSLPLPGVKTVYVQREPVYVARVGREAQSTAYTSLAKHIADIKTVAIRLTDWYREQTAAGLDADREAYYRSIAKYAVAAYMRQTCTVTEPAAKRRMAGELREFWAIHGKPVPALCDKAGYPSFTKTMISLNFHGYGILSAIWRKNHKQ